MFYLNSIYIVHVLRILHRVAVLDEVKTMRANPNLKAQLNQNKGTNRIITIEIHEHDFTDSFNQRSQFFNFSIKNVRNITDKGRQRFYHKTDNNTGNISELKYLCKELQTQLEDICEAKYKEVTQ